MRLDPDKAFIVPPVESVTFLGFELHADPDAAYLRPTSAGFALVCANDAIICGQERFTFGTPRRACGPRSAVVPDAAAVPVLRDARAPTGAAGRSLPEAPGDVAYILHKYDAAVSDQLDEHSKTGPWLRAYYQWRRQIDADGHHFLDDELPKIFASDI